MSETPQFFGDGFVEMTLSVPAWTWTKKTGWYRNCPTCKRPL